MPNLLHFFTDPVLRGPTIGSMLMCLSCSLIGVIVFIRKRSLLGESLSHASYPGIVLGVVCASWLFPKAEEGIFFAILIGAFLSSLFGLWAIDVMERRCRVKSDAALCFVLSSLFGIGILIASRLQFTHALMVKHIHSFLYGQSATMTDMHIVIYGILCSLVIVFLGLLYRFIEVVNFDRTFAQSVGMRVFLVDGLLFLLLVLAIVIGIRSVGVVLMAGMLIAPAVAARQFTHRLFWLFVLAGAFGVVSGFFGNYLSLLIPETLANSGHGFSLPTGPMILLTAAFLCLLSLLFAPQRGLFSRLMRIQRFKFQCVHENILKALWKRGEGAFFSLKEIAALQNISYPSLLLQLRYLVYKGWLEYDKNQRFTLTASGSLRACKIVRLHRLWEAYLVDYLGQGIEKVHRSAEEMEHILTDEIEKELTELLNNPTHDPHKQPIPSSAPIGVYDAS